VQFVPPQILLPRSTVERSVIPLLTRPMTGYHPKCNLCLGGLTLDDQRPSQPPDQKTKDELRVEQSEPRDELRVEQSEPRDELRVEQSEPRDELRVEQSEPGDEPKMNEPAIARWRAELEARRRAGLPDVAEREKTRRDPAPKSRSRWFVWVVLALLAALLVDLAYVGFGLRSRLLSASSSLGVGREAIVDADYEEANQEFRSALNEGREAIDLENHLGWRALGVVPGASDDTRAASVLASVTELSSLTGLDVIRLYERLGATRTGIAGAFFEDGTVRLDLVAEAARSVSSLTTTLLNGSRLINEDLDPRLGPLDDALKRVRHAMSEALGTLGRAKILLSASPSLFGDNKKLEYLLVIQNPSRSRAAGGVIEYYGILSATDGKLELGSILPISTLEEAGVVKAWSTVNRSVDFPAVAREILRRYEDQTGNKLQGVIAADSIALQYMSKVTGPVRGEGLDLAIGEDNTAKVLMHDVFEYFSGRKDARDRFVADVVRKIWFSVTRGVGDSSVLLDALARSVREQHMKMFASQPNSRDAMDQLELSGDPALFGPSVQSIVQNSLSASKVDFFLRREANTQVMLGNDGSASVDVTLTIENRAPDGPPSLVLGTGSRPGTARLSLEMLLPQGTDDVTVEGREVPPTDLIDGHPLIVTRATIPPGKVREIVFGYELPPQDGQNSSAFSLLLLPAPLAFPDRASVSVFAPNGFCINSCDDASPNRWDVSTLLTEPLPIRVNLVSADG
jgi:Protein of unknown function (DUF4012)